MKSSDTELADAPVGLPADKRIQVTVAIDQAVNPRELDMAGAEPS